MDERHLAPPGAPDDERRAGGVPDVRGWDVIAEADGRRIGRIADLLAEDAAEGGESGAGGRREGSNAGRSAGTRQLRYLDVTLSPRAIEGGPRRAAAPGATGEQLRAEERGLGAEHAAIRQVRPDGDTLLGDENPADGAGWDSVENRRQAAEQAAEAGESAGSGERHALVPVGRARIDRNNRQVLVEGLASVDAAGLPQYLPGEPAASRRGIEEQTLRLFGAGMTQSSGEEPAEDHGLFDEDHFYGARAGAGPAQPGGTPPGEPTGEEEPVEAGLRRDTAGLRHERDVNPRR